MDVRDLLAGVRVADERGNPTPELLEIMARLIAAVRELESRVAALEA